MTSILDKIRKALGCKELSKARDNWIGRREELRSKTRKLNEHLTRNPEHTYRRVRRHP